MVCANTITGVASTKQRRAAMFRSTEVETKAQHPPQERDSFSPVQNPMANMMEGVTRVRRGFASVWQQMQITDTVLSASAYQVIKVIRNWDFNFPYAKKGRHLKQKWRGIISTRQSYITYAGLKRSPQTRVQIPGLCCLGQVIQALEAFIYLSVKWEQYVYILRFGKDSMKWHM